MCNSLFFGTGGSKDHKFILVHVVTRPATIIHHFMVEFVKILHPVFVVLWPEIFRGINSTRLMTRMVSTKWLKFSIYMNVRVHS